MTTKVSLVVLGLIEAEEVMAEIIAAKTGLQPLRPQVVGGGLCTASTLRHGG